MKLLVWLAVFSLLITGCRKEYAESYIKIPDWTEITHGDSVLPDYGVVFPGDKVLRFDISITEDDWKRMQADLNANIRTGNPPPPVNPYYVPLWVPCSFSFGGREWYKAGIRYKGNSSLKECVRRNIKKYSFKIDFDEFEDDYPAIKNQRFYGFKQLNLSNGFDDMSLMHESIATHMFRNFAIQAPRTSFCEIWIDYGQGSKYFGLYTVIEEVEETVINNQFTGGGNLYKPEGQAATFAKGTYNTFQFFKQTNTDPPGDYADIKSLYDIINSGDRITANAAWRANLESVFDVRHFLRWLAANTIMENWDTYGKMSHNYYLYNNPSTGRLTWIPWDNNESLRPGKQGGGISFALTEVTAGWPLIRYIADDPAWYADYRSYIRAFITDPFVMSSISSLVDTRAALIRQYALAEVPGYTFLMTTSAFDNGIAQLKQHCQARINAAGQFAGK